MIEREPSRLFEFGPFCLDTRERSLSRSGEPVALTPKSFEILLALVENRGHTLTKDELIDRVWPDSFVEIGNLNRNISTLRSLLGDDTHQPKFIKTLPKRGYRFDADVREVIEDEEELEIERRTKYRVSLSKTQNSASSRALSLRGIALILGVTAVAVLAVVLSRPYFQNSGTANAGGAIPATRTKSIELHAEARHMWNDRSGESLHKATVLLEQVVAYDPDFALGHAALADAYAFDLQNRTRSENAARRAIDLDPTLAEPHATLGFLQAFWEWDIAKADDHFKKAVALDPDYATGHQWYAMSLAAMGQGNESLAEIRRAHELDPESPAIGADLCQSLYFNRRLEEAEAQCLKTIAAYPRFLNAHLNLYEVYSGLGRYDEAVEQFFKAEEFAARYSIFPGVLERLRSAYSTGGIREFWKLRVEMLAKLPVSNYETAKYHARLGNADATMIALGKSHENRELDFINFLSEPLFVNCCYQDERYWRFPPFLPVSRTR